MVKAIYWVATDALTGLIVSSYFGSQFAIAGAVMGTGMAITIIT